MGVKFAWAPHRTSWLLIHEMHSVRLIFNFVVEIGLFCSHLHSCRWMPRYTYVHFMHVHSRAYISWKHRFTFFALKNSCSSPRFLVRRCFHICRLRKTTAWILCRTIFVNNDAHSCTSSILTLNEKKRDFINPYEVLACTCTSWHEVRKRVSSIVLRTKCTCMNMHVRVCNAWHSWKLGMW